MDDQFKVYRHWSMGRREAEREPLDDRNIADELDVDGSQWEPCDQCIWGHGKIAVDTRLLCKSCYTAYLTTQGVMPHKPFGLV